MAGIMSSKSYGHRNNACASHHYEVASSLVDDADLKNLFLLFNLGSEQDLKPIGRRDLPVHGTSELLQNKNDGSREEGVNRR